MKLGNERNLIPVISMLSRQSKSIEEALELFQSALAGEIGDAALLIDPLEQGISPSIAKSTAAFLDSRQFPFRGLYTAPLTDGNRKIGRLVACFGSFGAPGKSLPELTSHVARQLSDILSRTSRAVTSLISVSAIQPATTSGRRRNMSRQWQDRLFRSITASTATWPGPAEFYPVSAEEEQDDAPVKALLVNAHPDDESESAAVVYRITHESGGTVDQVVVTNGEGGHQYAALAEAYYRLPLTTATDRRELLCQIRREELMRASRILGIRHNYFLDQKDTGATLSAADAFEAWDISRVKQEIRTLLQFEKYNLVVLLLPTPETHGHHQTVAALTLEAIAELEAGERPAALGVRTVTSEAGDPGRFSEMNGYPLTRTTSAEPVWSFDRKTPLSCHRAMDYSIVVNWVIAEHKSQGFFQMEFGRRTLEYYWLFEAGGETGAARWRYFVQTMAQDAVSQERARA